MNIADWLSRTADRAADAPALFLGAQQVGTYADFAAWSSGTGTRLAAAGIVPGDRVAMLMSNKPDYLTVLFGIWYAGAVAVPINAKLAPTEVAWIIADCGAKIVFCDNEHAETLAHALQKSPTEFQIFQFDGARSKERPKPRRTTDLAWIFYTSGTTGRPKGAMLSHGNLAAMSLAYLADVDNVEPEDCAIYAAPMSHGAGLYSLVHVLRGARHAMPESGGFWPDEIFALSATLDRASMFAAPTMVRRMTETAVRASSHAKGLKTLVYGGGPMYRSDLLAALKLFGSRLIQIYGQGECPMTITVLDRADHGTSEAPGPMIETVGRPHSGIDLRVMRQDGTEAACGEAGEVEARGPTVMSGYFGNPDATSSTLVDGWLRTGDIGSLDTEGYLTLTDRSKDVIISGGSNIYPREVEEVLLEHSDVAEAAVIGLPDPEWGEVTLAIIVQTRDNPQLEAELNALCLQRIARFKRPKKYLRRAELPKNNYGKVLKSVLRDELAQTRC